MGPNKKVRIIAAAMANVIVVSAFAISGLRCDGSGHFLRAHKAPPPPKKSVPKCAKSHDWIVWNHQLQSIYFGLQAGFMVKRICFWNNTNGQESPRHIHIPIVCADSIGVYADRFFGSPHQHQSANIQDIEHYCFLSWKFSKHKLAGHCQHSMWLGLAGMFFLMFSA